MSDEITITLPVSGKEVVIRNYTTRKDDKVAEDALYAGVKTTASQGVKPSMEFPLASVMASTEAYVRRLVKSIDGSSSNIALALDDLRSEDYLAIETAVNRVVEENSPKAQKVANASATNTSEI